jgi:predicted phage tail protein
LPSAIQNFQLKSGSLTATTATLQWTPSAYNGGSPITSKVITHTHNGVVITTNANHAETEKTFYGLNPGTTYTFQIASVNAIGQSSKASVSVTTTAASAPGTPRNFHRSATTTSTITLSWNAPNNNGGAAITSYKLEQEDSATNTWTLLQDANLFNKEVSNLVGKQSYNFRVTAVNSIGASATPASLTEVANFLPTGVTNLATPAALVTDDSITLTWDRSATQGHTDITNYKLSYTPAGGVAVTINYSNAPDQQSQSYQFLNLVQNTAYTFSVTEVNANGDSVAASVTQATKAAGTALNPITPGAPGPVTRTSQTDSTITLSWTAPANNGGAAVSEYQVQQLSGSTYNTIGTVSTTSFAVTGLTAGTSYSFRVLAKNSAGLGVVASYLTETATFYPSKVANLVVAPLSLTSSSV